MEVLSVAGFIAPADVWSDFETKWNQRLADDGLPAFHMSECANYRYTFEGWREKERQRQKLLRDLLDMLKPLSRKFGCTIPTKLYKERLSENPRERFKFKAYVIAARSCVDQVREWCRPEGAPQLSGIQFFFERGDQWQPELKLRMVEDGFPEPIFKPKMDVFDRKGTLKEPGLVPFQAADILAYIAFLSEKFFRREMDTWDDKESIHWMREEILNAVPGEPRCFTPDDLDRFETLLQVNDRGLVG
ncbi:MAG: hypothetical protein AB7G48_20085 [Nitrospiraceae bacterium]